MGGRGNGRGGGECKTFFGRHEQIKWALGKHPGESKSKQRTSLAGGEEVVDGTKVYQGHYGRLASVRHPPVRTVLLISTRNFYQTGGDVSGVGRECGLSRETMRRG